MTEEKIPVKSRLMFPRSFASLWMTNEVSETEEMKASPAFRLGEIKKCRRKIKFRHGKFTFYLS